MDVSIAYRKKASEFPENGYCFPFQNLSKEEPDWSNKMLEEIKNEYTFYDLWPARGHGILRKMPGRIRDASRQCMLVI